jgi:hypothetical protein
LVIGLGVFCYFKWQKFKNTMIASDTSDTEPGEVQEEPPKYNNIYESKESEKVEPPKYINGIHNIYDNVSTPPVSRRSSSASSMMYV